MESNLTKEQIEYVLEQHGELEHFCHEGQKQILKHIEGATDKELILFCSRRYGKSYLLAIYTMMLCLKNPNYRCTIVAPSRIQTTNIVQPIFKDLLGRLKDNSLAKFGKSANRVLFKNGSEIFLSGFDTCAESLRGMRNDFVGLEESGSFDANTYEYNLKSVIMPTLAHSKEKLKIIHATTASTVLNHPVNEKALKGEGVIKFTIYDNPLLDTEQVKDIIEECGGEDTYAFQTEYLCNVIRHEESVCLPSFSSNNIYNELVSDDYIVASLDNAGSRDKTAYIEAVCIEGKIYVTYAHTFPPMTDTETKANFLKTRKYNKLVGDIAGVAAVEFNKEGIVFQFPSKTGFEEMLVELNGAFRREELFINSELKELIDCVESTRFNKSRTDYERTSLHGHGDLIDALKYLYRMKKLFELNEKKRQEQQKKILANDYDSTAYIHELKRQYKEKQLAEGFKFKRGK